VSSVPNSCQHPKQCLGKYPGVVARYPCLETASDGIIRSPRSVCNVSATSQETLQGHAAGMKHKRRVRLCLLP